MPQITSNPEVFAARDATDINYLSADSGFPSSGIGPYIVIELIGGSLSNRGDDIITVLSEAGIQCELHNVSGVLATPDLLQNAEVLILDASCGSGDGTTIDSQFITLLVRMDLPTVLVGRAAWLIHRLRKTGPPGTTAPIETQLQTTPEFTGAVFLTQPQSLSMGSLLTTEAGLNLPVDDVQTDRSRLIELTGTTTPAALSPLRYESWPLDVFIFGPEDPALLTGNGKGLLVNTVAYATSLRENPLANLFKVIQSKEGHTLAGGLHHSHIPSIAGTYHAVHAVNDLMDSGSFTSWRSVNQALVLSILSDVYVDMGSEAGFSDSQFETVTVQSTAMGLWLTTVMGLGLQFSVTKLTAYVSSRQSGSGDWSDDMTTTFHITEALFQSGGLGAVDTVSLESWLRSCVIDGATGSPENWGGLGRNPTDGIARNIYSSHYVQALWMLGKAHTDPAKLTEWIQDTSNGDGTFNDAIGPDLYVTRGTVSALTTMSILGTLAPSNQTTGLSWLASNQLPSGGFGLGWLTDDVVAKTWSVAEVASCLSQLGETSGTVATGLLSYVDDVRSDNGFEVMEEIPSLMWSYWLSELNRFAHTGEVNNFLIEDYLNGFDGFGLSMYPGLSNLSVMSAPEYNMQQYYLSGTWAQFFGVGLADSSGTTLSPSLVSDLTFYLALRQHSSGHYRPFTVGTPHMQYSVAAVEALFQLDELDTIWYRSELDSAILDQYSSGLWNSVGWNLAPFGGVQSAIDYLSTRTALRLDLVTPLMASEIANTIESRLQYNDLWALSWDVKTLALLNFSSFSFDLESLDRTSVLSALGSTFADGWFNSSDQWQPIFTTGVLDMVSVLGLRPQMVTVEGCSLTTVFPATVQLGSSLDIPVTVTSPQPIHSIYVHIFDLWILFENVTTTDTLTLTVPSDSGSIGLQDISLVVWNKGMSRAFDHGITEVLGSMEGALVIPVSDVIRGNPILGTVAWTLIGGGDAGPTDFNVKLSNATYFEESTSTQQSPYNLSVPTDGFSEGIYNLIVTLSRTGCDDLVLWQPVSIAQPLGTFISSVTPISGGIGNESQISWSLHFNNGSVIADELVSLTVWDGGMSVVHTDAMVSVGGQSTFSWTPNSRGLFTFNIHFAMNGVLMESDFNGTIQVFDQPSALIFLPSAPLAPSVEDILIFVLDSSSLGVSGVSVHTLVTLNGSTILDLLNVTTGDGSITFPLSLDTPGGLDVTVTIPAQGWILGTTNQTSQIVLGKSNIVLSLPGIPIDQGHVQPLSALLLDWTGVPLIGAQVDFTVSWFNGTVIDTMTVFTGADGTCATSHYFVSVGDFWVEAVYGGNGLDASNSDTAIQRVHVTPIMILNSDPSVNVGDTTEFFVALHDNLAQYIDGRTLDLTIVMDSVTVFQTQVSSVKGLASILWTPAERGLALITLSHVGDVFIHANSTTVSMSVLEVVGTSFDLDTDVLDLFDSVVLTYTITATDVSGVDIVFQVLGMDLVPVWTQHVLTDGSGVATTSYLADDVHGLLRVTASPDDDQFMIGGNTQTDLTVMSYAHVVSDLFPEPPSVLQLTNVTLFVTDDLDQPIDGLRIYVRIRDTYNDSRLVQSLFTVEGLAIVQFTPDQWGLYSIEIWSTGGQSIHAFAESTQDHEHTVHCPTSLTLATNTDIEVGDTITITARLLDLYGASKVGFNVNLTFTGSTSIGPLTFVTNNTGHVSWELDVNEQGYWTVDAQFFGLGVFLPCSQIVVVHSSFGTSVVLELQNQGDIIAGVIPLNVTSLLLDSAGTPLEGRTIDWDAYHATLGLMASGSVIQLGVEPEIIEIMLLRGGNFTVIFSYAGTDHYHSSNTALDILVKGTSEIIIDGSLEIDRASRENMTMTVHDELGFLLDLEGLTFEVSLTNASGLIPIPLWINGDHFNITVFGLEIGDYTLNITVSDSIFRTGSGLIVTIRVVSQSALLIESSDFSGIVGQSHTITFRLVDSMNKTLGDMTVWVSLYHPDGSEIYGNPLGVMTPIVLEDGLAAMSWNPSGIGNYTVAIRYVGDDWRFPVELWIDVLTRRLTTLSLEGTVTVEFLDIVEMSATLSSQVLTLGGMEISFTVLSGTVIVAETTGTTSSRGVVTATFVDLFAGEYSILAHYEGTDSLAPCTEEFIFTVSPKVTTQITPASEIHVDWNVSIYITVSVQGVNGGWLGTVQLSVFDPSDTLLLSQNWNISKQFNLTLFVVPKMEGQFTVNVTVIDLPVVDIWKGELHFASTAIPMSIVLDAGSTPVIAGTPIIALIGFILRRKFGGTMEGLPTEWGGL
jgi:hypothetical protein